MLMAACEEAESTQALAEACLHELKATHIAVEMARAGLGAEETCKTEFQVALKVQRSQLESTKAKFQEY